MFPVGRTITPAVQQFKSNVSNFFSKIWNNINPSNCTHPKVSSSTPEHLSSHKKQN